MAIANGATAAAQTNAASTASPDNTLEQEIQLYKRVGQILGVKIEDYASSTDYANALINAINKIKANNPTQWPEIEIYIEQKLGLDKLGVSLDTVISAISGNAESSSALYNAIKKNSVAFNTDHLSTDESNNIGLYSQTGALQ